MYPLIIPTYNQPSYLLNLINWWQFRFDYPIYVLDNNSTSEKLLKLYRIIEANSYFKNVKIIRFDKNEAWENLKSFLPQIEEKYYIISPADIIPDPDTPQYFPEVFRHCIEVYDYHHAGFCLNIENVRTDQRELVHKNESGFWANPVQIEFFGKKIQGYKAPIDATFCMYKTSDGWASPMDGDKWSNSIRLFNASHLTWYLESGYVQPEMDEYFKSCRKSIKGVLDPGANTYRPNTYD